MAQKNALTEYEAAHPEERIAHELSPGEISHIVGAAHWGKPDPEATRQVLAYIKMQIEKRRPLDHHALLYLATSIARILEGEEASVALGLKHKGKGRPRVMAERHEQIAHMIHAAREFDGLSLKASCADAGERFHITGKKAADIYTKWKRESAKSGELVVTNKLIEILGGVRMKRQTRPR